MKGVRISNVFLTTLIFLFSLFFVGSASRLYADNLTNFYDGYVIEIVKSKKKLYLKKGDKVCKEYNVAVGKGGSPDKLYRGDNRTPEGVYRIRKFNYNSRFVLFMGLDYPNKEDAENGLRYGLISFNDYLKIKNNIENDEMPPQNTELGGQIGIHGMNPNLSAEEKYLYHDANWTNGCIALENTDILDLYRYCTVGTKVVIKK
jgi:murein L,D-transpeptidase YafK